MTAGLRHTAAILNDGTIRGWGYNGKGQLGIGNIRNVGDGPNDMGNNMTVTNLGSTTPVSISAGGWHTCIITEDNKLKCWGEVEELCAKNGRPMRVLLGLGCALFGWSKCFSNMATKVNAFQGVCNTPSSFWDSKTAFCVYRIVYNHLKNKKNGHGKTHDCPKSVTDCFQWRKVSKGADRTLSGTRVCRGLENSGVIIIQYHLILMCSPIHFAALV